jgi:hypothetical protein
MLQGAVFICSILIAEPYLNFILASLLPHQFSLLLDSTGEVWLGAGSCHELLIELKKIHTFNLVFILINENK